MPFLTSGPSPVGHTSVERPEGASLPTRFGRPEYEVYRCLLILGRAMKEISDIHWSGARSDGFHANCGCLELGSTRLGIPRVNSEDVYVGVIREVHSHERQAGAE